MDNHGYIEEYFGTMAAVIDEMPRQEISAAIDLLFEAWQSSATVYIAGNGGSSSTASHFACDLAKWTASADNMPIYSALMNDEGPASVYSEQLEPFVSPGDVLILISVHGGSGEGNAGAWSQNLLRALGLARERGARTIGLSGFDGGALKRMSDVCIVVPIDSTPQVESFHLAIEHLICDRLRERISEA